MRNTARSRWTIIFIFIISFSISGCGYNVLKSNKEQVKSSWHEALSQYQRRNDLVPKLVDAAKSIATQEQIVLSKVLDAHAKVGRLQMTPNILINARDFAEFEVTQNDLSRSLSQLLLVAENYPELNSDENFNELQTQLREIEERLIVARNRHIKAVQNYNQTAHSFPASLTAQVLLNKKIPTFTLQDEYLLTRQSSTSRRSFANEPAQF